MHGLTNHPMFEDRVSKGQYSCLDQTKESTNKSLLKIVFSPFDNCLEGCFLNLPRI